jgi:hypothetical protein
MIDPFNSIALSLLLSLTAPSAPAVPAQYASVAECHAAGLMTEVEFVRANPRAIVITKVDIKDPTFKTVVENMLEVMKTPPAFAFDAIMVLGPRDGSDAKKAFIFSRNDCVLDMVPFDAQEVRAILGEGV